MCVVRGYHVCSTFARVKYVCVACLCVCLECVCVVCRVYCAVYVTLYRCV